MLTDIQNQIANNTTSSSPFVTADDVIYFRGTDDKLFRVNSDGSGLSQIGHNSTKSTPFVTADGWVWFHGTDNRLYKVFKDGTQLSRPGANDTYCAPVVVNDVVYFQGKDNVLFRMDTAGSAQKQIDKCTTKSTPFVTADGWVWFQGTDDHLYKVFNDGTQLSRPGANDTSSPPVVVNNVVYFRGKDNVLFRMNPDGSGQSQIGKNTTKSTPFVTPEGWVYFQGTDDHLYRVFNDGTQLSRPGANDTYSSPVVGRVQISAGTVGEWVYFQSIHDDLDRLFQPVDRIATGTLAPKYYILTLLYAPPGTNGGKSSSIVDYSSGSSTGTTTTASSAFKSSFTVSASVGIADDSLSAQFDSSTTTTDQSSENITKSQTYDIKEPGPGEDGINHDHDVFLLMLNPLMTVNVYPGNNVLWTMGVNGQTMNLQEVYVGWLKSPSTMPAGVKQELDAAGLTAADYAQILSTNPFANGATTIDPNRFLATTQTFPYEPPFSSTDPVVPISVTVQNSSTSGSSVSVQTQYEVSVTVSAGFNIDIFKATLKDTDTFQWTNTNTLGLTTTVSQSAAATVGGPAFGYSGPTDVLVYWDTIYNSFMFAFPTQPPAAAGRLLNATGAAVANAPVALTAGGHTFKTFTNAKGQYRFYGTPAGPATFAANGKTFTISVGGTAELPTLRLQ